MEKVRAMVVGPRPSTRSTVLPCSGELAASDCLIDSIFLAFWGGGQADDRRESESVSLSGSH